ncbi:MAG: GNAT family N-acetyltransferase [Candidatus Levyibacteriota bacterium]
MDAVAPGRAIGGIAPTRIDGVAPARIEEAGLNAQQTQRQLFYDGWLLRLSPGKARRARSVNAHFGSTLPLDAKIGHCERVYAAHGLPALFRVTPFVQPADLDDALDRRGYVAFDPTLVQVAPLQPAPDRGLRAAPRSPESSAIALVAPPIDEFVRDVGALRGSPDGQRAAHLERLARTPLATRPIVARRDGRVVACGLAMLDGELAGIFDMLTDAASRGQGLATRIVAELLAWARGQSATHAYLQVDAANAPALAVYRKFGFATAYAYHYRARPGECG